MKKIMLLVFMVGILIAKSTLAENVTLTSDQMSNIRYIYEPGQSPTTDVIIITSNRIYHKKFRGQNHFIEGTALANDLFRCRSITLHNIQQTLQEGSFTHFTYERFNLAFK